MFVRCPLLREVCRRYSLRPPVTEGERGDQFSPNGRHVVANYEAPGLKIEGGEAILESDRRGKQISLTSPSAARAGVSF
jgi:hypothetical protein